MTALARFELMRNQTITSPCESYDKQIEAMATPDS